MAKESGIKRAVKKYGGSPTKLAEAVGHGVLRQHVEHWLKVGRVSADKAPDVEVATGVPCEELCPGPNWAALRASTAKAEA